MSVRVEVKPELLEWACRRAGGDVALFADAFPKLPKWLDGTATPTLKQLEAFAQRTRAPIGYFFLDSPPDEPLPIADFRTMKTRRRRPSPDLLETLYVCQRRQEWYREYAEDRGDDSRKLFAATCSDNVLKTAARLATNLGFETSSRKGVSTAEQLVSLLSKQAEHAGVLVMRSGIAGSNTSRPLDPKEFRGFALFDPVAPLVFVNGADAPAAQLFTLAHELAHVLLGETALSDTSLNPDSSAKDDNRVEHWCNAVAAEFLVPEVSLRKALSSSPIDVDALVREFKVSKLVILRRLFDVGAMDKATFKGEFQKELARIAHLKAGKAGGGNFYVTQISRVGRNFAKAMVESARVGKTLYREAFQLLGVSGSSTFEALGHHLGDLR